MPGTFALKLPELASHLQALVSRSPLLKKVLKTSSGCIGLDIGSFSVKAALVELSPAGFELLRVSASEVPPNADSLGRTQLIQRVLGDLDGQKNPVVTAVGGPGAVLRPATFPKMTSQEFKTALGFEAEKYIPFKLEEAFIDPVILGDLPGGRMEVFLAAARKELVNSHAESVHSAGAILKGIDLEAVALANAWEVSHPEVPESQTVAQIHVGARGTILNFLTGLKLTFTREIPLAGEAFTQALIDGLQIDRSEAERIKCQPGEQGDPIRTLLLPKWEEWVTQLRQSFDFYENQFGHRVESLTVSGGSIRLSGFVNWIKEQTGLPTSVWDPLSGLSTKLDAKSAQELAVQLGVAVGCAVRGASRD